MNVAVGWIILGTIGFVVGVWIGVVLRSAIKRTERRRAAQIAARMANDAGFAALGVSIAATIAGKDWRS